MVNWQDPQVIENWTAVLVNITFVVLGLFGCTSPTYIPPLKLTEIDRSKDGVTYIPARSKVLSFIVNFHFDGKCLSAVTSITIPPHIDCYYVLKFLAFSNNIVRACASANLVIRTVLVHFDARFVIVDPAYSAATSMYTIFGHWRSSPLSLFTIIRTQGISLYFIVLLASFVPFIFSWLNLNFCSFSLDHGIKLRGGSNIHHASETTVARSNEFFDLVEEMMVLDSLWWSTYCVHPKNQYRHFSPSSKESLSK
ncbi:hypothetical protein F4604DRAFT_1903496 [Suillus subluteus]|nr:hypothetical protein F4604DRAFT_1903496 [Suillus subluteus]